MNIPRITRTPAVALRIALAILVSILSGGVLRAAPQDNAAAPAAPPKPRFQISFKLDPSITRGMYMGDRWVSPPVFSFAQAGKEFVVDAKAESVDAMGNSAPIRPRWTPADPDMVAVAPAEGHQVRIVVKREGQTSLKVTWKEVSKALSVKSTYQDNAIRVVISQ